VREDIVDVRPLGLARQKRAEKVRSDRVQCACILFGELLVWHPPEEELVGNDAGAPHVDPAPVRSLGLDLRRLVLHCAAQGISALFRTHCPAEVCELHMAVPVKKNILQLYVAMNDVLFMEVP